MKLIYLGIGINEQEVLVDPVVASVILKAEVVDEYLQNTKKVHPPSINESFLWKNTQQGHDFWHELSDKEVAIKGGMRRSINPNHPYEVSDEAISELMVEYYTRYADPAAIQRRYKRAI